MTVTNYYCACGFALIEAYYHEQMTGWRCSGCGKTDAYDPPRSAVSKWDYTPTPSPAKSAVEGLNETKSFASPTRSKKLELIAGKVSRRRPAGEV